jgi:hypothetical protein
LGIVVFTYNDAPPVPPVLPSSFFLLMRKR